jgi:ectoine hydroxylase-related dioxygenase (phytanoyl-CoA dioxygenase family)
MKTLRQTSFLQESNKSSPIKEAKKNFVKGVTWVLHKKGIEGWVVVEITYDEETGRCSFKELCCPDYKALCIEKIKKLVYGSWW